MSGAERLIAAVSKTLGQLRSILSGMGRAPEFSPKPYLTPYLKVFANLAEEGRLDETGLRAGVEFAQIWDQKARGFMEQKAPRLHFDDEEITRMLKMLPVFEDWVKRNFP